MVGVAVLALVALGAQSCGKKESLILVSVTATPEDPTLQSLTITIEAATEDAKMYTLSSGLSSQPVVFGVYVSSDVTGIVVLHASATNAAASVCVRGTGQATIGAAGATV
ncbi:MAG TPA: hypothetical protein VMT47_01905, partial [Polyangia bacterium]|nr:hypothetical protein [Polyangia bacterium]